jgi:Fur family ferric uptake transcriptional regulator
MPSPEPVVNRNTRQRRAIRDAFVTADRPLNPNEVLELAAAGHEGIGIATVYRNIKNLVEEGWLTTVELPGESARYELAGKAHHHHFHCRQCGKVYELSGCLSGFKAMAPEGFAVTGHEVLLYGVCRSCGEAR